MEHKDTRTDRKAIFRFKIAGIEMA